MIKKPLLLCLLALHALFLFAQENTQAQYSRMFQNGTTLYRESRWKEASVEFMGAREAAKNKSDLSEALYWGILAQLAFADYNSAFRNMDELEKVSAGTGRSIDILYHRARAYYIMDRYEDAMINFVRYNENITESNREISDRKAASYFWTGECLYSMAQFEKAEDFYNRVISQYPHSPKVEVSSYRLELIKQKKIENELLSLLKWSHEEALKNNEDNQRKLKTYEHAINTYHKRIVDLSQDSRLSDLESSNAEYQRRLAEAEEKINLLENDIADYEKREKESLLLKAKQLKNDLQWDIKSISGSSQ